MITMKIKNLRVLIAVLTFVFLFVVVSGVLQATQGQSTDETLFEIAYKHQHQPSDLVTWQGVWIKRSVQPAGTFIDWRGRVAEKSTAHLLGNAFTILGDADGLPMMFFRLFDAQTDGTLISQIESRTNARVRVTYDPRCGYATKIELLSFDPYPEPEPMPPNFSVAATPTNGTPGQVFVATWNAPEGQSNLDWIGVYRVGADDQNFSAWGYTAGASSGSLSFPLVDSGTYEFRYFLNDGFVRVANSNPVSVTIATPSPSPTPTPTPSPTPSPTPLPTPTPTPTPAPSPSPTPRCIKVNPKGKCIKWA